VDKTEENIVGMIGIINIIGLLFYVDILAFKLKKRIKAMYLVYYASIWTIVYMLTLLIIMLTGGTSVGNEQMGFLLANGIGYFFAYLIVDFIVFFVCRALYKRVAFIRSFIGESVETKEPEIEQKHKNRK
jgi:hypothetical protein